MALAFERRRIAVAAASAAGVTAIFAAWMGLGIGSDTVVLYVSDVGTVLAALTATVLCARAAVRADRLSTFWLLVAIASGTWAMAETVWAVYDLVLRTEVPVPSFADIGYLGAIPFVVVALVLHPAVRGRGTPTGRLVLDALSIATALLFLSWILVLGPLWRGMGTSTLGEVVTLAYPFSDVVMLFLVVLAVRGMERQGRLALWCLLAGLVAMAMSDSVYAYITSVKGYEGGSVMDAGWFASYLAIGLAAYFARAEAGQVRSDEPEAPVLSQLVTSFVPVIVALIAASVAMQLGHGLDGVAWASVVALIALVLIRQALFIRDVLRPGGTEGGGSERLERAILIGAVVDTDQRQPAGSPGARP